MKTRGKKVNIDPSLIPHTREELREVKQKKESDIQAAKDKQEAEKTRKATTAQSHIAQVEDAHALEQAKRQSLRPDLDLEKNRPQKPQPIPKLRKNPGKGKLPTLVIMLRKSLTCSLETSNMAGASSNRWKMADTQIEVSPEPGKLPVTLSDTKTHFTIQSQPPELAQRFWKRKRPKLNSELALSPRYLVNFWVYSVAILELTFHVQSIPRKQSPSFISLSQTSCPEWTYLPAILCQAWMMRNLRRKIS